jgi:hypothetical protein
VNVYNYTLKCFSRSITNLKKGKVTHSGNLRSYQYCDIITEERAVTRLRKSRQLSITTITHEQRDEVFCAVCEDCCHPSIRELLEAVFSVTSVPRLYKEDQLPLRKSLETAVRRRVWCGMAVSLRGRETGSRGMSSVEGYYPAAQRTPLLITLVFV